MTGSLQAYPAESFALGLYEGVSNEAYHDGPGVSKSTLDLVHQSPSLVEWNAKSPRDEEADAAVDVGNAFEALLLEPERFAQQYIGGPANAPRNTKDGKAKWAEVEAEAERLGATIVGPDDWRKIHLMRDSVMAHPVARRALNAEIIVQPSYYWIDETTGLLCRCRPDLMLRRVPFVLDVKTSGQIERFGTSVEDYRYHVQDAFYTDGLQPYYGEPPSFAFIVVSTSRSAGRYPVHVYELDAHDKWAGRRAYRDDIVNLAACVRDNEWTHVEPLSRPWWARKRDDEGA